MINRFGNDIHHILHVDGIRLRHESSARGKSHGRSVKRGEGIAVRRRLGHKAFGRHGACLPFCQAVNLVVENDIGDIHISLHRMEGVSQTDGVRVAVTGADDHMNIFVGAFDALGKRKRASMGRVGAVAVLVPADAGRTADTGNQNDIFIRPAFSRTDSGNRILDPEVAAPGTPVRHDSIFIISR